MILVSVKKDTRVKSIGLNAMIDIPYKVWSFQLIRWIVNSSREINWVHTAQKVSVFGDFLVCVFPHSDWIRRDTLHLPVFSPNTGKYVPEKHRIRIFFSKCQANSCASICTRYCTKQVPFPSFPSKQNDQFSSIKNAFSKVLPKRCSLIWYLQLHDITFYRVIKFC